MSPLVAGDKVEVLEHSNKKLVSKRGTVVLVGTTPLRVTQPVTVDLPKMQEEPCYSLELDGGGELHNLKGNQLRKVV